MTVSGEAEELQRFLEAARPHEDALRSEYDERWIVPEYIADEHRQQYLDDLGEQPPFEEFKAKALERQPLSFESLHPQPSDEELKELESYKTCTMCGGDGSLAYTEDEQLAKGGRWYEWMGPDAEHKRKNRNCNVCGGDGQERVGMEGWYEWRLRNWGTKWDASFGGGPMIALGGADMDVDTTVEAQGATLTPTVAVFKFDTAWSPPAPVIEVASEQHPELEFVLQFAEVGHEYAGRIRFVAGVTVEEEELEVEDVLAPEELWF